MGQSFADIHAALAHAMAGNEEYLKKLIMEIVVLLGILFRWLQKLGRLYLKTNGIKPGKSWKLLHLNLNVLGEAEHKRIYLNLHM